jgi:hypothetical protein
MPRTPYEAPRLDVIGLRPEEQLLSCMKDVPRFPCFGYLAS